MKERLSKLRHQNVCVFLRTLSNSEILWRILLLLIGIAAVRVTLDLGMRAWFELQCPEQWDASVYWAMGRGILNGLTPYKDLFDNKPPGIYLIAALSLLLSGGRTLGCFLQASVFVGITLIPTLYVGLRLLRHKRTVPAVVLLLSTYVFFGFLAQFTATRSGEFQTESFGAFFGILYAIVIAHKESFTLRHTLVASLFLLCSIGIKEPFILPLAAVALLFAATPSMFTRAFIIPITIAAIVGSSFMLVVGWLGPYISIYLQEMLSVRTQGAGDPLSHALSLEKIHHVATEFYVRFNAPFFGALSLLMLCCIFYKIFKSPSLPKRIFQSGIFLLALYLVITAVYLGGTLIFTHHFVVVIPFFAGIFLFSVKYCLSHFSFTARFLLFPVLVLLLFVGTLRASYSQYLDLDHELRNDRTWANANGVLAAPVLDALLDDCTLEQYQFIGRHGPMVYEYTKHSPMGPLFLQYNFFFDEEHPQFHAAFLRQLDESQLIVVHSSAELGAFKERVDNYLAQYFTETPWSCAAKHVPIPGHTLLFRVYNE